MNIETFFKNLISDDPSFIIGSLEGEGSGKEVYSFDKDYVIKIPKYSNIVLSKGQDKLLSFQEEVFYNGKSQISFEINIYNKLKNNTTYNKIITPIIYYGLYKKIIPYIVQERVDVAEDILDTDYCNINDLCEYFDIDGDYYCKILKEIANKYNLSDDDLLENSSNFGFNKKRNRIEVFDLGYTNDFIKNISYKELNKSLKNIDKKIFKEFL